jgi:pyruvate-formate lyase-activating enzyme
VKKGINLVLEDDEIIELMRILMDSDAEAALEFLRHHFKGKARDLLEGG